MHKLSRFLYSELSSISTGHRKGSKIKTKHSLRANIGPVDESSKDDMMTNPSGIHGEDSLMKVDYSEKTASKSEGD